MFSKPEFCAVGTVTGPVQPLGSQFNDVFLFDLDALTTSDHGHLDHTFASYLRDFALLRPSYLVSRLNYNDIMLRLPSRVRKSFAGVFTESGSELWVQNEVLVRHEHDFTDDLYEFVAKVIQKSSYPKKQAPMIDCGSACMRICIAGARSTIRQVAEYREWEEEHGELAIIMDEFRARFPRYSIYRDTDTSLLIMPGSFSSAFIHDHIARRHKSARLIGYMTARSVDGYANPLVETFNSTDILSTVGGPSDVSQLLSYEKRCLSGREYRIALEQSRFEEV